MAVDSAVVTAVTVYYKWVNTFSFSVLQLILDFYLLRLKRELQNFSSVGCR